MAEENNIDVPAAGVVISNKISTAKLPKLTLDNYDAWYGATSSYLKAVNLQEFLDCTDDNYHELSDKVQAQTRTVFLSTVRCLLDKYKQTRVIYNTAFSAQEKQAWDESQLNCRDFLTWVRPIAAKHLKKKVTALSTELQNIVTEMARKPAAQHMKQFLEDVFSCNVRYFTATGGVGWPKSWIIAQIGIGLADEWDHVFGDYEKANDPDLDALQLDLVSKAESKMRNPPTATKAAFGASNTSFTPPPARKSEPCRDHGRGHCPRGRSCPYDHGQQPSRQDGRGGGRNNSSSRGGGNNGSRSRPVGRTSRGECFKYRDNGDCEHGDDCRFLHGENDHRFAGPGQQGGDRRVHFAFLLGDQRKLTVPSSPLPQVKITDDDFPSIVGSMHHWDMPLTAAPSARRPQSTIAGGGTRFARRR
jgi:hypothetical protein